MNCEKYRKLINKYIDNEIEEEELSLLSTHLEVCEDCKILLYDLQNLTELSAHLIYKNDNKSKSFIKNTFLKVLLIFFIIVNFKFLSFLHKEEDINMAQKKEDRKVFVEKNNTKKVYLIDFEFPENMVLK